jgi:glycine dehydrogenase subunit 2
LIVEEALMVEPTEAETKDTLDHFVQVMRQIAQEAVDSPSLIHEAPHDQPVGRLDETTAARKPVLRWSWQAGGAGGRQ